MAEHLSYREQLTRECVQLVRQTARELPRVCGQFLVAIEPTTTPLTRLGYARDLRLFFHFLKSEIPAFGALSADDWTSERLAEISADHLAQFMEYLTYYQNEQDAEFVNSEAGKMRKLSTLRSFYKYLFKNDKVPADISALVDMPKRRQKPILRLEIDEVARLLDMAEQGSALSERQKKFHEITRMRDLTMLTLFLGTGIRVSECVGLNVEDIDLETGGFLITRKGGHQVILYMPEEVEDQMRRYLAWRANVTPLPGHESALFLSIQQRRMGVRAVENMVKKYALLIAPLKKRMSPHKLRATFGTNLYGETGDIYLVADVLGHADVNTTRRHYAAMADDRRRQAARSVVLREKRVEKKEDRE
ncbi:MAG: tyrosine-type recombinase/integrase [Christensenellaceae bacterium]|nr:tyrosine-type recombinase/integrase [Christensenellaceae bacterium]